MGVASQINEITVAPALIQSLDLSGFIVTEGALLTQRAICAPIHPAGGDHALPVKANLVTIQRAIADVFWLALIPHSSASLTASQAAPDRFFEIMRQHWHIENRLLYVRDVTFHEDDCRLRNPHVQHGLAILNNFALGLIRQFNRFSYLSQARRYLDAHLFEALQLFCS